MIIALLGSDRVGSMELVMGWGALMMHTHRFGV
jgi:hypothetical protein